MGPYQRTLGKLLELSGLGVCSVGPVGDWRFLGLMKRCDFTKRPSWQLKLFCSAWSQMKWNIFWPSWPRETFRYPGEYPNITWHSQSTCPTCMNTHELYWSKNMKYIYWDIFCTPMLRLNEKKKVGSILGPKTKYGPKFVGNTCDFGMPIVSSWEW